jgi:hypothetical protein
VCSFHDLHAKNSLSIGRWGNVQVNMGTFLIIRWIGLVVTMLVNPRNEHIFAASPPKRRELDKVMKKARRDGPMQSSYWNKKLLEVEEKDPNRFVSVH